MVGANELRIGASARYRPAEWLTPLASENGVIFLEDGAIGCLYEGILMPGVDAQVQAAQVAVLKQGYPAGTVMQCIQRGDADLRQAVEDYRNARADYALAELAPDRARMRDIAISFMERRGAFLEAGAKTPPLGDTGALALDVRLFFTLRVPIKGHPFPSDEDLADFAELREKMTGALEAAGQILRPITAMEEILGVYRWYFDPYGDRDTSYNPHATIKDQVVPPGTHVRRQLRQLRIKRPTTGQVFARTLVVSGFPKRTNLRVVNPLAGDPSGLGAQIGLPYALTTTIHFPDQGSKVSGFRQKQAVINQQAFGPMLKWSPVLAAKKEGFDCMGAALDGGDIAVEMSMTLTMYHTSPARLNKATARVLGHYNTLQFRTFNEWFITWATFLNQLPLQASPETIKGTYRFVTMSAEMAAQFLPIIGDWLGYGSAMKLHTRRLRPASYDVFHRANKNKNWLLFAESGAGKSFAVERIIQDHLSLGDEIVIIDRGRSHVKSTAAAGGQVIEFLPDSKICLNGFTNVTDIDEEIGMHQASIGKMVSPSKPATDQQNARIVEAIKSVWANKGRSMGIDDIYRYFQAQADDPVALEMGRMLFPFSARGPYGHWFNGENNLDLYAPLICLELNGLERDKLLQDVVLMQLYLTINQRIYHGDDRVRKMVIGEEMGDLLPDEANAKFFAQLYSKSRKHSSSIGIVLQSLSQLYRTGYGAEIAASASTMFIMSQTQEAIQAAREKNWLVMSDAAFELLSTVHTRIGAHSYSEIFVKSDSGMGIMRLIESRFNQILFSTEGRERTDILAAVKEGRNVVEAIEDFMRAEGTL
ncbi:hypothetical protein BKK80_35175 (plasmid) [Cupriavidus malaysiensis]|uniref:TraG P-loop domain-containing protein n=2 Tax=Cupriavidus malaysiensis TaxID=367825 RepID=A0ABN4TW83_9BURK|nr:hypothetical protein BKK80_35175 [Cupriavidus malaysiensis]